MLEDGLVDAQDESERLETLFLTALRHIVNLEAGFTGPMPEREAREAVARTFIGGLWRNSCKHKDSPLQLRRASLIRYYDDAVVGRFGEMLVPAAIKRRPSRPPLTYTTRKPLRPKPWPI